VAYLIEHREPEYPAGARDRGIEGVVMLDLVVGRTGAVETISVRRGDPLLASSALETVRGWKFSPVLLNGNPVEVETDVVVNLALPGRVWSV
jgi:periplasmic protein TonB